MEREVNLDHLFIDGTLVQSQTETKAGKNSAKAMEKELVTCSLQEKEKTAIDRNQIFEIPPRKDLETKVIVVLGKAGMGKSILIQKICQDWSNGEFSQFEFVFWFDCKQISLPEKQYSLKELAFTVVHLTALCNTIVMPQLLHPKCNFCQWVISASVLKLGKKGHYTL